MEEIRLGNIYGATGGKHVEVRQATKEGSIPCKIGGGGRFELSQQPNTQRTSAREWRDKSNVDNGEYP